ncbi:ABC transporter ATP-binding protein [Bacillus coahuilensis]|uniref:ABC transporter ATP-binding protein n=1 Tax=Bacillus coahuilensis TaxID=408580 RepID=UPI000ADA28F6|nr:ABC transporter ATP-binding protein [Bacillus coahuilensis]
MNNQETAIKFTNVGKRYSKTSKLTRIKDIYTKLSRTYVGDNEFWALKDISFEVMKGDAIGIIGSNGSGKSTLLKLLSGVTIPTEGNIEVNGTIGGLIELGAGFHPEMTGRENVYINGAILGLSKAEIDERFPQIIEFSGLADFIDMPLKSYSSGMKVRLGFAIATTIETDIVLLDEVLAVGDSKFRKKAMQMMESFLTDKTIVFVSHDIGQIKRLCNKCVVLNKGRMVFMGDTENAIEIYQQAADENQSSFSTKLAPYKTHLVEANLINQNGELVSQFNHEDKIGVELKINIQGNRKNKATHFKIKIKADELSTFSDTLVEFNFATTEKGIIQKTVWVEKLPFYNGKYNLDVLIQDSQKELLDIKTDLLNFLVINHKPDFKMRGVISFPHNIEIINNEQCESKYVFNDGPKNISFKMSKPINENAKFAIITFHKGINSTLSMPLTHFTLPLVSNSVTVLNIQKDFLSNGNYHFDCILLDENKKTIKKEEKVFSFKLFDQQLEAGLVNLQHRWE